MARHHDAAVVLVIRGHAVTRTLSHEVIVDCDIELADEPTGEIKPIANAEAQRLATIHAVGGVGQQIVVLEFAQAVLGRCSRGNKQRIPRPRSVAHHAPAEDRLDDVRQFVSSELANEPGLEIQPCRDMTLLGKILRVRMVEQLPVADFGIHFEAVEQSQRVGDAWMHDETMAPVRQRFALAEHVVVFA